MLTAIDLPDDHAADALHPLRLELAARAMPQDWFALFDATAVLACAQDEPGPFEVTLTLVQPDARLGIAATLRGSSEALAQALSQPPWRRLRATMSPLPPDWALRLPVPFGHAELSMRACRELAAGDVVLVTRPCFDPDGQGRLRIGTGVAKCTLHAGNQAVLELTEWHATTTSPTMNDALPASTVPLSDGDDALDDLPITLTFELGALELPLSELKLLAPGSVLPIAGPLPPEVAVCAGGRRIGTGELVEVEGRLGVEIRRIGAPS
jgi:type III secretion system YscQ/HrcQ family protein